MQFLIVMMVKKRSSKCVILCPPSFLHKENRCHNMSKSVNLQEIETIQAKSYETGNQKPYIEEGQTKR